MQRIAPGASRVSAAFGATGHVSPCLLPRVGTAAASVRDFDRADHGNPARRSNIARASIAWCLPLLESLLCAKSRLKHIPLGNCRTFPTPVGLSRQAGL